MNSLGRFAGTNAFGKEKSSGSAASELFKDHSDFQQVARPLSDDASLMPEGISTANAVSRELNFYKTDVSTAERLERLCFAMVVAAEAVAAFNLASALVGPCWACAASRGL